VTYLFPLECRSASKHALLSWWPTNQDGVQQRNSDWIHAPPRPYQHHNAFTFSAVSTDQHIRKAGIESTRNLHNSQASKMRTFQRQATVVVALLLSGVAAFVPAASTTTCRSGPFGVVVPNTNNQNCHQRSPNSRLQQSAVAESPVKEGTATADKIRYVAITLFFTKEGCEFTVLHNRVNR